MFSVLLPPLLDSRPFPPPFPLVGVGTCDFLCFVICKDKPGLGLFHFLRRH